ARTPSLPLVLWLLIQLASLCLAAARVRVWNRFPLPGEQLATDEMLVAQIIAASMLFPVILSNLSATACCISSTMPFLWLSALLSGASTTGLIVVSTQMVVFLVALRMLARPLKTNYRKLFAIAAVIALTIGLPLLGYLGNEF